MIGIFVLGILVVIHELGHFFAAKACRIGVLSFSIGFGKPVYKKKIGETEYRISSIPFGGYVHMKGEHPEDAQQQAEDSFMSKPVWQRASVAIAGPAANIISSIFFLWLVFVIGVPHEKYLDRPVVGSVVDSSVAYEAGIAPGDSIIAINSIPVSTWEEIQRKLAYQESEYKITYIRKGITQNTVLKLNGNRGDDILNNSPTGLMACYPAQIGSVNNNSPAEKTGLQKNDFILSINNTPIYSWFQFSDIVSRYHPLDGPMNIILRRNGSTVSVSVKPSFNKEANRYLLGIQVAAPETRTIQYNAVKAIFKALDKSLEYTTMIFEVLSKLLSAAISPKQLAGPVGIIQMSGAVALISIVQLLNFMALIGINLGVLNLFPLIITDGGVLFFLLIESIRRKPLSLKAQMLMNRIAISLFITLFLFVTFQDFLRIPKLLKLFGQ
jgi:regulator of sigma E protease